MALKFYYSPQSNATRIHWSLKELGVPYEEVRVDLRAGDTHKPEFLAVNPNGMVPTIELDGTPMFESVAIQIALGERFGVDKGLWPATGSAEHLTALSWLVWGQVTLSNAMFRYMTNTSDWFPKEQHNEAQAAVALTELHKRLAILDRHLATREYITGSRFTLVDLDLVAMLGWGLMVNKIDTSELGHLRAWMDRARKRPNAPAPGE